MNKNKSITRDLYYYNTNGSKVFFKTVETDRDVKTRSSTVRRPKPVDLFANGTALSIYSETIKNVVGLSRNTTSGVVFEVDASTAVGSYSWSSFPDSLVPPSAPLDNRLLGKIKASNANLAVDIAEIGKTRSMITDLAVDVVKTFRSLRSGRALSDFVRSLKDPRDRIDRKISRRWLEYNYGWTPLMGSIHSLAGVAANRITDGITHSASLNDSMTSVSPGASGPYPSYSRKGTRRVVCQWKVSDPSLKTLTELGFTNPASLVWELLPWSFVLDWGLNVGDYLGRIDALSGVSSITIYDVIIKETTQLYYRNAGETVLGNGLAKNSRLQSDLSFIHLVKEVNRSAPRVKIANTYGGMKNPFNVRRLATSMALLSQLSSSTRRVP